MTGQNLSNYLPPGMFETLTPEEVRNAIYGSKFVFVTEHKGLPKQHRLVKWVGGYCVLGYVVTQILFLGVWCRPIQQYWQVPVDNSQCASYYHHLVTASVFNISSDLIMLLIPLPMLIKARLPFKRKLVLCGVFSLGIFVILAAILNRYYNFTAGYGSLIYLNWYAGEAATAVMVANIPHCWPILSRVFRLGSFKATSQGGGASGDRYKFSSQTGMNSSRNRRQYDEHGYMRSESEERIANAGTTPGFLSSAPGDATPRAPSVHPEELEMGRMKAEEAYMNQEPYIGTAITAGNQERSPYEKEAGTIVKTVSMNQTVSDHH
ncbi:uncharacterized protein KY384_007728 [Bacidia gigantensis]|uniref:uncharacterized protein n=1 Tax=Bacidia gigantensis TaxID=2732470 RepID=UPI001D04D436|nr:uncharacterized protein KY384_007728 [Bacidia gigantensis]KAG8527575.1 hypothetical protein KY384_007728 [Bacidia gigantensis]